MPSLDESITKAAKEAAERAVAEALLQFHVPQIEYLTTEQAATFINYSTQFLEISRHKADGSGPPYIKQQRAVRYRRADLDAWMAARRVVDEPPPAPKALRRAKAAA
jgi:hypothetical protein